MPHALTVSAQLPGAYPTINDALEVAEDGAVISIEPGVYSEALRLSNRRLSLVASESGTVTVDATGTGQPALACRDGDVTVRGLILKAADYPALSATGGRLQVEKCQASAGYAAAVSVSDGATVEATDLTVTGGQYGIVLEDAGGTLDKCEVRDITDDGIIVRLGADPVIRNSTVAGCGYRGVYIYQAGAPDDRALRHLRGWRRRNLDRPPELSDHHRDLGPRHPRRRHLLRAGLLGSGRSLQDRADRGARDPVGRGSRPHRPGG